MDTYTWETQRYLGIVSEQFELGGWNEQSGMLSVAHVIIVSPSQKNWLLFFSDRIWDLLEQGIGTWTLACQKEKEQFLESWS